VNTHSIMAATVISLFASASGPVTEEQLPPDAPAADQATLASPPKGGHNVSCRAARAIISAQGFHHVKTADCSGKFFDFTAWRLQSFYKIRVRRSDGLIVSAEAQRIKPLWDQ